MGGEHCDAVRPGSARNIDLAAPRAPCPWHHGGADHGQARLPGDPKQRRRRVGDAAPPRSHPRLLRPERLGQDDLAREAPPRAGCARAHRGGVEELRPLPPVRSIPEGQRPAQGGRRDRGGAAGTRRGGVLRASREGDPRAGPADARGRPGDRRGFQGRARTSSRSSPNGDQPALPVQARFAGDRGGERRRAAGCSALVHSGGGGGAGRFRGALRPLRVGIAHQLDHPGGACLPRETRAATLAAAPWGARPRRAANRRGRRPAREVYLPYAAVARRALPAVPRASASFSATRAAAASPLTQPRERCAVEAHSLRLGRCAGAQRLRQRALRGDRVVRVQRRRCALERLRDLPGDHRAAWAAWPARSTASWRTAVAKASATGRKTRSASRTRMGSRFAVAESSLLHTNW